MTEFTFNPFNDTVTWIDPTGEVRTMTYLAWNARKYVVEYLHYDGQVKGNLTPSEEVQAWTLCDGFGHCDLNELDRIGWDWSHVRDSSDEAMIKTAEYIRRRVFGKDVTGFADMVSQFLKRCKMRNMDPIRANPLSW